MVELLGPGGLELRPLQAETLEKVRQAWRGGAMNVLVQAPCGFGKTEIATAMLMATYEKHHRGAFVCDRLSLLGQTSQRFDKYRLEHGIIQGQHERYRPDQLIQLCSVQTVHKRQWPRMDLLIADEVHTLHGSVAKKLEQRSCRAVGLTATPFRKGLGKYFDTVINATTTNHLIREGWLTPFRIFAGAEPDMEGVKLTKQGEWDETETTSRVLPIVGDCVQEYLRLGNGRKFICFAVSVAHAQELSRQFMQAGIIANLYTYRESDEEKAAAVEEFRKPNSYIRGLISIEALTRGFDVADVGVLILARPLRKSLTVHLQMLGRVLRTAEGKTDAIVLDHASNCIRFWSRQVDYLEYGVRELDDGTKKVGKAKIKEQKPMKCPTCKHVHSPRPICPICGHEYARKNTVHHIPGELRELAGKDSRPEERLHLFAQLLWIARERDYADGWAARSFKERVGHWPDNRIIVEPIPPTSQVMNWVRSRMIAYAKSKEKAQASI